MMSKNFFKIFVDIEVRPCHIVLMINDNHGGKSMKTGFDAIEAKEKNPAIILNKYADPIEDASENIDIKMAYDVASEDPSLIWCAE